MLDIPLLSKLGKRVIFGSAGEDTICPYIEQIRGEWRGREHLSDMLSKMMSNQFAILILYQSGIRIIILFPENVYD